ncbi:NAD(P)-dependent dehydrogenase (short-subunit alcohol dehydrogenase family) [Saccharomonospora amisosensis]|uniref:NAD(P)-dependent dehydrogenase (Short-subunit alcohol dehydrogenase family) n=1 Tax=Saccharomonospora amisosensis TaxID=1128677 RepID=A0A7X5ZS08_9PSEU|nr:KR domain-containing protein [Saccharomonospora amisosensis]NIJ13046.1 NAD(P)-dependent dehydrogenase (short-subunit alcohol dehydrogenase family) [Saccharomonospora amisosensis]
MVASSGVDGITVLAAVRQPVPTGRFVRRCWQLLGHPGHPAASEFASRSAPPRLTPEGEPAGTTGTAVLLGGEFGWTDNAHLLNGIAAARRDGGRLALVHLGAGGASLLRSAAVENPRLDVRSIELCRNPSARAVRIAVTLAGAERDGNDEFQIDNTGRITRTQWQPVRLPDPVPPRVPGSVLVTGGLGGLGLRAASVLAHRTGLHPVLVDRLAPTELAGPAARHLTRLRSSRTGVTVLQLDLTDRQRSVDTLGGTLGILPPVRAVLHCAGVLYGGPVEGCTSHQLLAAQRVKVAGLRNLLAAVPSADLRSLITFGSITAEHAHRSLGCYALANELLRRTTLEQAAQLPGCATVAAQWSLWSGAGMASGAGAVSQARRMGMVPVSLRAGMATLPRLLSWPEGAATALLLHGRERARTRKNSA